MPTCPLCKIGLANSKQGYSAHMARYHGNIESHAEMMPINVTGRTKEQIVRDWETKNAEHLIFFTAKPVPVAKSCDESCTCNVCIQKKFDALDAQIEEENRALQNDPYRADDRNKL